MKDRDYIPAKLMPKWWQTGSSALLYAAYALWLVPVALYFWGSASLLGAFAWLVGVIVVQFVLVKLIALIEFMATGTEIDSLRARDDAAAQQGDKN
jgi:VIT1/CCC1 family predicted Fe2+/Mn2+ transporter